MPDAVLVNATEAADNVMNATEQEAQEKPQDIPETETKQETDDSNNQEDNSNSADSKQNGFTVNVQAYDDDDDAVFIGRDLAHAKAHSEAVSGAIDMEVKAIIDDCYAKAKAIILEHESVLHACAELLLEKEKIGREEFEALFQA